MTELELSWSHVFRIAWCLCWRQILGGAALGFIGGGIAGFMCGILSVPNAAKMAGAIVGGIAGLIWGFTVLRMAIKKSYKGFRLAVIAIE
ncbi:hypothetical protein [Rhizomicrobium electricum]|uniref:Uncharacterized protein n=1 Tax=Rhizomicrobium electricum TaxID=480070 RepID=A0ABP3PBA0_9PROT|nr:hypothetical protein [Rhizomicrobium electricum]NIJ48269.1 tetrahydromethanopterin S-methyltransferase subunit F [Rhizomicrobium electricum]